MEKERNGSKKIFAGKKWFLRLCSALIVMGSLIWVDGTASKAAAPNTVEVNFKYVYNDENKTEKTEVKELPDTVPYEFTAPKSTIEGYAPSLISIEGGYIEGGELVDHEYFVQGKTATITSWFEGERYQITVNYDKAVRVNSIKTGCDNFYEIAEVGKPLQMNVNFSPENASDTDVTWKVSDENIATIDEYGLLAGKKTGKVTVTATSVDNENASSSMDIWVMGEVQVNLHYNGGTRGEELVESQTITVKSLPFTIPYRKIEERIDGYLYYPHGFNLTEDCQISATAEYNGMSWDDFYDEYKSKPDAYEGVTGTINKWTKGGSSIDVYINHVGLFTEEGNNNGTGGTGGNNGTGGSPDTGHVHTSGDWIVDKQPTATEEGSQHKICTVCGAVTETSAIAKTSATSDTGKTADPATQTGKSPKTGESSSLVLYLCVVLLSGSAVSVCIFRRKGFKK